ncbi:MAG: hypothetical protein E7510_09725 [Ruminococcus sp.]|nr:hypothetical protein [Ruminococcus sp.]
MSWHNPNQDEAAEEFYSSRRRFANAATQKYAVTKAAERCWDERNQTQHAIRSCMSDKLNFEKRIEDIRMIIGVISGAIGGSMFGIVDGMNIPDVISSFNNHAKKTDESFRECMKCSEIVAASIHEVFKSKSVDEDLNLSDALKQFRDELARLEQVVRDLQTQMDNLSALVNDLSAKISSLNAEAVSWRKVMLSSAYEMNHFRKFM